MTQATNKRLCIFWLVVVAATPALIMVVIIPRMNETILSPSLSPFAGLKEFWLTHLLLNLTGYATVVLPFYLFIYLLRRSGYLQQPGRGWFQKVTRNFVEGQTELGLSEVQSSKSAQQEMQEQSFSHRVLCLFLAFTGLQASYLTWGVLQERIMTHTYGSEQEAFKDSEFLVFMNRICAFFLSSIYCVLREKKPHVAPYYIYSYASFSNILSSWFQYEALKFVSFPTQVLAKASKIIPTMLMGRCVQKKSYPWKDYVQALMITAGIGLFLLTSSNSPKSSAQSTTLSGFLCLLGYLVFDGFTTNWQDRLFTRYKMSNMQMMCGVNFFSFVLTLTSLSELGGLQDSIAFMLRHPDFALHVLLVSLTSATGQLFIYFTIARFGAVTFTIIMTIRQAAAILLSCILFGHEVAPVAVLGVAIVFAAIFYKVYCNLTQKKETKKGNLVPSSTK